MRWVLLVWGVLVGSAGCAPQRAGVRTRTVRRVASEPPSRALAAPIGRRHIPAATPEKARRLVAEGERALRAGALSVSARLLAHALAEAPGDDEARLATIKLDAKQGHERRAIDALVELLREAPGVVGPHWRMLAALLGAAPDWKRAERALTETRRELSRVEAQGVPAVAWRGFQVASPLWTSLAAPGFYSHHQRRFVAIGPRERGYVQVLVAPESHVSLALRADVDDCKADFCPRLNGGSLTVRSSRWPFEELRTHQFTVGKVGRGCCLSFDFRLRAVERGGVVDVGLQRSGPRTLLTVSQGGVTRSEGSWSLDGTWAELAPRGANLILARPSLRAEDGVLVEGRRRIFLGPEHKGRLHSVDRFRDTAVVVTLVDGCICTTRTERSVLEHTVSLVDLRTGIHRELAHGQGTAAARFGGDGTLYVQEGRRLAAYPPPYVTKEFVPNVLLTVPRARDPNCCGL